MRIGELARRAGVTTRALRYYEQQGLLRSRRQPNGYREYDETAVSRVYNIRVLLNAGLTSEDIVGLGPCLDSNLDREPACTEAIELFEHRLQAVGERIEALVKVHGNLEEELRRMRSEVSHLSGTAVVSTCALTPHGDGA